MSGYYGWPNRITWAMSLYLDELGLAAEATTPGELKEAVERLVLDWLGSRADDSVLYLLVTELVHDSLSRVDWNCMASFFVAEECR